MLLRNILKNGIISDGDWDGVFATGLLINWAYSYGIIPSFYFPSPVELKNLSVIEKVSVEIVPTKTVVKNSIIFDHHEGPQTDTYENNNIWIYGKVKSVARLVANFLEVDVDEKWILAIDEVDSANIKSELSKILFKAYQADVTHFPRDKIAKLVAEFKFNELLDVCKELAERYEVQEKIADKLIKNSYEMFPNVKYFFYKEGEEGAKRIAMIKLEDKNDIVIAIGKKADTYLLSIGTKKSNIDLRPLFEEARKKGYNAGGRENIGGIQSANNIDKILDFLKENIKKLYIRE